MLTYSAGVEAGNSGVDMLVLFIWLAVWKTRTQSSLVPFVKDNLTKRLPVADNQFLPCHVKNKQKIN